MSAPFYCNGKSKNNRSRINWQHPTFEAGAVPPAGPTIRAFSHFQHTSLKGQGRRPICSNASVNQENSHFPPPWRSLFSSNFSFTRPQWTSTTRTAIRAGPARKLHKTNRMKTFPERVNLKMYGSHENARQMFVQCFPRDCTPSSSFFSYYILPRPIYRTVNKLYPIQNPR